MRSKILTLGLAMALCISYFNTVLAEDPEDQIKYRQAVMKIIGGHMTGIASILKGKISADHMLIHAQGMATASVMTKAIFPDGSDLGETRAKEEIWSKPDEFQQTLNQFESAVNDFLAAAESGDNGKMGEAMKALGGSCKSCHDDFRTKKK